MLFGLVLCACVCVRAVFQCCKREESCHKTMTKMQRFTCQDRVNERGKSFQGNIFSLICKQHLTNPKKGQYDRNT